MNWFLKTWYKAKADPIWSKVVADGLKLLIYTPIGIFIVWAGAKAKDVNFGLFFSSMLNYKVAFWVYLLLTAGFIVVFRAIKIWRKRKGVTSNLTNPGPTPASGTPQNLVHQVDTVFAVNELPKVDHAALKGTLTMIFNSAVADDIYFTSSGEKSWNRETNHEEGQRASGKFTFSNGILEIKRTNLDGRFLIKFNRYYSGPNATSYIASNTFGRNPRPFNFAFLTRTIKGEHKITIAWKRLNGSLIDSFYITAAGPEWVTQTGSFNVIPDEDFYLEFQCSLMGNEFGTLQIKAIIIKEMH